MNDRRHGEDAIRDTLVGIDLDADDERITSWLAATLDVATVATIASLFQRVRQAGVVDAAEARRQGACSACGLTLALTPDGLMPWHGPDGRGCRGSRGLPLGV